MSEYSHASYVKANGEVFRSATEAMWAQLFSVAGIAYHYEPTTFVFPNGKAYVPDFYLPKANTYIEIKNGNVSTVALQKINDLAKFLGRQTLLINGTQKRAHAFVFDGRPPEANWQQKPEPVYGVASREIMDHRAILGSFILPAVYGEAAIKPGVMAHINARIKNTPYLIDYNVSPNEVAQLQAKLLASNTNRVYFSESASPPTPHPDHALPRQFATLTDDFDQIASRLNDVF